MARMLLRTALIDDGAIRNGKSCSCCTDVGATRTGAANRKRRKRQKRSSENHRWKNRRSGILTEY